MRSGNLLLGTIKKNLKHNLSSSSKCHSCFVLSLQSFGIVFLSSVGWELLMYLNCAPLFFSSLLFSSLLFSSLLFSSLLFSSLRVLSFPRTSSLLVLSLPWIIYVGVCSARGFRKMLSMWGPFGVNPITCMLIPHPWACHTIDSN